MYKHLIEQFVSKINDWNINLFLQPEPSPIKAQLRDFFTDPARAPKLSKGLGSHPFAILRLQRQNPDSSNRDVFCLVSHQEIGAPGTFGRCKLTFSLVFKDGNLIINLGVPLIVKIIRHNEMDIPLAVVPTRDAIEYMNKYAPFHDQDFYGFMRRTTTSQKSRYHRYEPIPAPFVKTKILELTATDKKYYLAPLFDGESLEQILLEKRQLLEVDVYKILLGITHELDELHGDSYAHLDLHPGNILVDRDYHVAIIDLDNLTAFGQYARLRTHPEFRYHPTDAAVVVSAALDIYALLVIISKLQELCPPGILKSQLLQLTSRVTPPPQIRLREIVKIIESLPIPKPVVTPRKLPQSSFLSISISG